MSRLALFVLIIGIIHRANGQACTSTWTTPSDTSTAYVRSIGAPTTLTISFDGVALAEDHAISFLTGTTAMHTAAWDATGTTFKSATVDTPDGTLTRTAGSSSTSNSYSLAFVASTLTAAQSGSITVTNSGCTSGGTSAAFTLTVQSCNLAFYGDVASAADQTACDYNCQRAFTCTYDTTETFTVTCGADASWSQKYAACPSASVREVALFALVMLCSSLSATHLM